MRRHRTRFTHRTHRRQTDDVQSVVNYVRGENEYSGNLATSLFMLQGMGVCAAYTAYYLIDKLANKGNFLSFLPDAQHRLAVVSEYLDGNYRLMNAETVIKRCCDLMRKKGLGVSYQADEPPGFTADQVFEYLFRQNANSAGVYCIIMRGSNNSNECHAIAAINGRQPYLMDPNIGEVSFGTRRDARLFFRDHFEDYRTAGFYKAFCYNCS